jgi:hypothetical protein
VYISACLLTDGGLSGLWNITEIGRVSVCYKNSVLGLLERVFSVGGIGVTVKRLAYGLNDERLADIDLSFASDSDWVPIALSFKSFESI